MTYIPGKESSPVQNFTPSTGWSPGSHSKRALMIWVGRAGNEWVRSFIWAGTSLTLLTAHCLFGQFWCKNQPSSHWGVGEHISLYVSPNGPCSTSWQHAVEQVHPSWEWKAVLQAMLNLSTLHWSKRIPLCLGVSYSKESKTIGNNSKRSLIPMELGWDLLLFPASHCVYINAAFLR